MAEYWAITTRELLSSLPVDCTIIRGCIKLPNRSPAEWKRFKRRFSSLLSRAAKKGNMQIAIVAKQHITHRGTDWHYDYIGWTTGKPAIVQRSIRQLAKSCEAIATCRIVPRDDIGVCSDYVFKFASRKKHERDYWQYHWLPATNFPVTWTLGNFWRRQPTTVTYQHYWDDELRTISKKLSGQAQVWREYASRVYGSNIPRFTTPEYRAAKQLKYIMAIGEPPATQHDWLITLNCARQYPDGVRIAPVYCFGKATGYYLVEAGSDPTISERLNGAKPTTQQVVSASEAERVRLSLLPAKPEAPPPPIPKPIYKAPAELLPDEQFYAELAAM